MKRFSTTATKVAILLGGSAVIGAAVAMNPAIADDAHSLLKTFGLTTCNSSSPCTEFKNLGSGPAIRGDGTIGIGVKAVSNSNAAVDARSTSAEGVVAVSQSSNAVRGSTSNPSGSMPARSGVLGVDASTDRGSGNTGVTGFSANGTGVSGTTDHNSADGIPRAGVVGVDASTVGIEDIGVSGSSTNGTGVQGVTSGGGAGQNIAGVSGIALAQNSFGVGVFGQSNGLGAAVEGDSLNGEPGVFGFAVAGPTSAASVGVIAESDGTGLFALVSAGDVHPAVLAIGGTTDPTTNSLVTEDNSNNPTFWVDNGGSAHVRGLIFTGGPCSAGCARSKDSEVREVQRYTPQEAVPTIEDVGEAQLSNGSAYVRMDPAFANVMDAKAAYLVFVTPQGLTRGLYVTNKTAQGFQVQEQPGGSASVAFDYRIVAKPFGQSAPRLPMITGPKPATLPRMPRPTRVRTYIHP